MENDRTRYGILHDFRLVSPIQILLVAVELHVETHCQEQPKTKVVRVRCHFLIHPDSNQDTVAKELDYK